MGFTFAGNISRPLETSRPLPATSAPACSLHMFLRAEQYLTGVDLDGGRIGVKFLVQVEVDADRTGICKEAGNCDRSTRDAVLNARVANNARC